MTEVKKILYPEMDDVTASLMCGANDSNLDILSECSDLQISFRDQTFFVSGDNFAKYEQLNRTLDQMYRDAENGRVLTSQDIIYRFRKAESSEEVDFDEMSGEIVGRTVAGKPIVPKTEGQLSFVRAIDENAVVFAVGPAGTGKTYLAVIKAVSALKKGEVKRIVLTRPAVEAGENLGFLPGDLKEKVDPYLTPLYDALHVSLGNERTEAYIEKGTIEIAPLAYMRGRTLDDAFVILDEAQNTTPSQMKMFLTRLGFHSKMVITGDITQIDLDRKVKSGLIEATNILNGIHDIAILHLSAEDVVRHPLVQKIIERYGEVEKREL